MVILFMWQWTPHVRVHLIEHVVVEPTCQNLFSPLHLSPPSPLSPTLGRRPSGQRVPRQRQRKTGSGAHEIDNEASKIDRELAVQPP